MKTADKRDEKEAVRRAYRVFACFIGNLLISVGVALAKIAGLGNDPCNGMYMSVADFFNIEYPVMAWGFNLAFFVVEIIWGRKHIKIGTFINWFLVSYVVNFILTLYGKLFSPLESYAIRIPVLVAGLIICSLGLALYQLADLGIAPYDYFPFFLTQKINKLPFFWARMFTDCVCLVGILLTYNGELHLLGIGTVLFAFGLGPVIHFFTRLLEGLFKKEEA